MNDVGVSVSAHDALIIALPSAAALDTADEGRAGHGHWWRVIDGQITQSGDKLDWLHPSAQGPLAQETTVLALAPAADVTLHHADLPGLTARKADAAGRLLAAEHSITPAGELHVVTGPAVNGSSRLIAATSDSLMAQWMHWLTNHGLNATHVVPAALLVPEPPADEPHLLVRTAIGDEVILRSTDAAFVADPSLANRIAGDQGRIIDSDRDAMERALLAALDAIPLDLRSGKWAKAPPALLDAATLRRTAWLLGLIFLASIAILLALLVRVKLDTAALDQRATAQVASVLTEPPPLDQAIPALDARLAALGGGTARLSAPYAALVGAMEPTPTVSLTNLVWREDGTLSVTLAAPRAEDINNVLLALQAAGYTITATPRSGTDGRTMGDITIRSAP